jgi:hypothetical protein
LAIHAPALIAAAKDLLAALKAAADIVEQQLNIIIESETARGPDGRPDLATLDPEAKPDVDRLTSVLAAARAAIAKAEGTWR